MIQSIELTNFQTHKHSTIEFCDGLNVITGSSDSGKSSVMRALLWVLKNRPSGDSVRNWDCDKKDKVAVDIILSEIKRVEKQRVDGKSVYYVGDSSGEYLKLEAIKQDVPEEVERVFNMSDINIQTQHDPYFLLNDSPGEVAKRLNELVGLDVIDRLFKNINGRVTDIKRSLEHESTRCNTLSEQISRLDYVDRLEAEIEELSSRVSEYLDLTESRHVAAAIVRDVCSLADEIDRAEKVISAEKELLVIEELNREYDYTLSKLVSVKLLTNTIQKLYEQIKDEDDWLNVEEHYFEISELVKECDERKGQFRKVCSVCQHIGTIVSQLNSLEERLERDQKTCVALLKKHNICPLCGSSMKDLEKELLS